jgi:competence protein ComEC
MAERTKPRSRAGTWPVGRRTQAAPALVDAAILADAVLARLRAWAAEEAAPGRLLIWLAVAFGLGIALYFTAEHEPQLWAAATAFAGMSAVVIALRQRGVSVLIALGIAAVAAGFFLATLRASRLEHPILQRTAWGAALTGYVEVREERARSDRIVVRVHTIAGTRGEKLRRVRVAVRKGTAPPVGSFVALKARLSPPPAPLRPGGYDFARDLYFRGIGAVGFALGKLNDPRL